MLYFSSYFFPKMIYALVKFQSLKTYNSIFCYRDTHAKLLNNQFSKILQSVRYHMICGLSIKLIGNYRRSCESINLFFRKLDRSICSKKKGKRASFGSGQHIQSMRHEEAAKKLLNIHQRLRGQGIFPETVQIKNISF